MKLTGLDHVTINCREPEESFRFYGQVLGLEKTGEHDLGDHVLHYYGLPGTATRLELIAYKGEQARRATGNTDVGIYRHMALETDDLAGLLERCRAFGCGCNMEPRRIPALGKTVMLIVDPNGVEIEFIQQEGSSGK